MSKTTINNTALEITRLNLGGNVFGWTLDEAQSFEILDAYNGGTLVLPIPLVGKRTSGLSESIIGKWMKSGNRDKLVIATKGFRTRAL